MNDIQIFDCICEACGGAGTCAERINGKLYQCPFKGADGGCDGFEAFGYPLLIDLLDIFYRVGKFGGDITSGLKGSAQ